MRFSLCNQNVKHTTQPQRSAMIANPHNMTKACKKLDSGVHQCVIGMLNQLIKVVDRQ